MDDEIEGLLVEVRADTAAFQADVERMRSGFDATVVDGFARAGTVLERGLVAAIRRGTLGFEDLKRVALDALSQIAAQAMQGGVTALFGNQGGGGADGLGAVFGQAVGALFGLPGRATGGPVSPGAAYLVGERGPEVFVPTSAGRVEAPGQTGGRNVRVSIQIAPPNGADAPTALRRSSRQIASSVRRALRED
ncbi:MAG: tail tape measure protein [Novosphingobium sp.]|nr:tail tape measure protein [Novosphingobium sp.]